MTANVSSTRTDGRVRIGLLGPGMISTVFYGVLPNLGDLGGRMQIVAVAGKGTERASAVAAQYAIPTVYESLDAMLDGADLDAVLNLTPAAVHYQTSMAILRAGKHLITEKPLAGTMAEADEICALASERNLIVVTAPVDMLQHDFQLAKRLVTDGAIGRVAFARLQSSHAGAAALGWPGDPSQFYREGAGSLLDLGVYGIHRATGVLGAAKRVSAFSGITAPYRIARGGAYDGARIEVTEADNTMVMLDFGDALYATIDATFNVVASRAALIEIYGSQGTIIINGRGVEPPMEIYRLDAVAGVDGWITPASYAFPGPPDRARQLQRGVLVEHLLDCLDTGAKPVLGMEHARHVLEVMLAAQESARTGHSVELTTTF